MADEPDGMDTEPLNEWVVSELSRTMDTLRDLMRRHEEIVNHLADICRRNDRMQEAGNHLRDVLMENFGADPPDPISYCDEAIRKWTEANN